MLILSSIEYFKGISNILVVAIQLIIGLKIVLKYPKYKDTTFLYIGLAWMLVISPYFSTVVSFLYTAIMGELISFQVYISLNMIPFPISGFLWLMCLTILAFPERKTIIRIVYGIYAFIFEIILIVLIFAAPDLLGTMIPPFIPKFKLFIIINYGLMLIILIVSGILFSSVSLKSKIPKVKLKGQFLLTAFIFLIFGGFLDLIPTPDWVVLIKRTFMILSSLFFYLGFYLPKFIEERFIKE